MKCTLRRTVTSSVSTGVSTTEKCTQKRNWSFSEVSTQLEGLGQKS